MKKLTVRKAVCVPFVGVGVVLLAIGLCIRYGVDGALEILQDLHDSVIFTTLIRGNK
jgi:hypothetical protein